MFLELRQHRLSRQLNLLWSMRRRLGFGREERGQTERIDMTLNQHGGVVVMVSGGTSELELIPTTSVWIIQPHPAIEKRERHDVPRFASPLGPEVGRED